MKSKPNPLATLPMHIIQISKGWFQNTKTGEKIPASKITDHLPKPPIDHEQLMEKRYDLRY